MKKDIQKRYFGLLIVLFFLLVSVPVFAAGEGRKHLFDQYEVYSEKEYKKANTILQEASQKDGVDYVVIYSEPFENAKEEEYNRYVEQFHEQEKFGKTALILLVDFEKGNIIIRAFGRMKPIFRDPDHVDFVADGLRTYLREQQFTIAVTEFVSRGRTLYRSFYKSKAEKILETLFSLKSMGISLLIALITAIGFYAMHNRKLKAAGIDYEITNSFLLEREEDRFSHITRSSRTIKSSGSSGSGGSSGGGGSSSSGSSGGMRGF